VRESNPPPWIHIPPSSQTSNVTINGAGARRWAAVESHHVLPLFRRTLLLNQLAARTLGGTCTRHRALERRASLLLDDEGSEPSPGIEPDPPAYGAGARPSSRKGARLQRKGSSPSSEAEGRVMPLDPYAGTTA